jgi:hypothetical protein
VQELHFLYSVHLLIHETSDIKSCLDTKILRQGNTS